MRGKTLIDRKLFRMLLGAGVFGVVAVFPYVLSLQGAALQELPLPLPVVLLVSVLQSVVLLSITIFIGLLLGKRVGLGAPLLSDWIAGAAITSRLKANVGLAIGFGLLAGVLIIVSDLVFSIYTGPITAESAPIWQGFLASFYGGIVEEILMRLFLVTVIVWGLWRLFQRDSSAPASVFFWVAIVTAAVVFGLGHLPATAALTEITPLIVTRAIVLNGIGGIIFGWLYWKKGLETAIIAHFTTDIVLHVLLPLFLVI